MPQRAYRPARRGPPCGSPGMPGADLGILERDFQKGGVAVKTGPLPTDSVTVSVPIGKPVRVYTLTVPLSAAV